MLFCRSVALLVLLSMGLTACVEYATAPAVTPFITPTQAQQPTEGAANSPAPGALSGEWLLLSAEEQGYAHLFRLDLDSAILTRLTWGEFHDVTPSISPDGVSVAFASDRGGAWDLYTMDLRTGDVYQLTNTPEYEGTPVWSPDMAWMAFEMYADGQLDIAIQSMTDRTAEPVLLTSESSSDHSPAWSPDGRRIAFVSNRTGDADIWLADLDKTSDRFSNLSATHGVAETHPVWTPDGKKLAWASSAPQSGFAGIYVWDATQPGISASWTGSGTWPAWSPDGTRLAVTMASPALPLLGAYTLSGQPLSVPIPLPGRVQGIVWPSFTLPAPLPSSFAQAALFTPSPPALAAATGLADVPAQRWHIVPIDNVQAPDAGLHAMVAPSFDALRARVIAETGWDVLASIENAFVPLTTTLDPGLEQDWLYTGRAFAINTLMLNAGWMSAAREDVGEQTYWRIFVRARNQDGSQGIPLKDPPWDLNARYQLEPEAYEAGGGYGPVPTGYWVDLTSLAQLYGWQRLPALPGWRTYYSGARFSEFAATGGLGWYEAMLELYPREALITPTVILPPTITPSRTPRPTTTPYPTWTPRPSRTPTITGTAVPFTATPAPTSTPPTIIPTFPTATP